MTDKGDDGDMKSRPSGSGPPDNAPVNPDEPQWALHRQTVLEQGRSEDLVVPLSSVVSSTDVSVTSSRTDAPLKVCFIANERSLFSPQIDLLRRFFGISNPRWVGPLGLMGNLSARGHDVTLVYIVRRPYRTYKNLPSAMRRRLKEMGVTLVVQPQPPVPLVRGRVCNSINPSYVALEYLKRHPQDVVHFLDNQGTGYLSALSKQMGLALLDTEIAVHAYEPSYWRNLADARTMHVNDLLHGQIERRSVELADWVFASSRDMPEWMLKEGYHFAAGHCFVQTYPPVDRISDYTGSWTEPPHATKRDNVGTGHFDEIVFWGRLDMRHGLHTFCNAIERLEAQGAHDLKLRFVGQGDFDLEGRYFVLQRSKNRKWQATYKIQTGLSMGAALDSLTKRRSLVVVCPTQGDPTANIEMLVEAGVPFIASDIGGVKDAIAVEDHARTLCRAHPLELSKLLLAALENGHLPPAGGAQDATSINQTWIEWHENTPSLPVSGELIPADPAETPLVTVCIIHFNRPRELRQALASLKAQTYRNFEVVLVDDGSVDPEAIATLDELRPLFEKSGWKIVVQENLYLGAARNTAVRHAKGRYVMFLDDDNCLKPAAIETFVRIAEQTTADVLTSFVDIFEGDDAPDEGAEDVRRIAWMGPNLHFGVLANASGDANAFVRRSAYEDVGGYSEDFGVGKDDLEFYTKCILAGKRFNIIPDALLWYRLSQTRMRSLHFSEAAGWYRIIRPYEEKFSAFARGLLPMLQSYEADMRRPGMRKLLYIVRFYETARMLVPVMFDRWFAALFRGRKKRS